MKSHIVLYFFLLFNCFVFSQNKKELKLRVDSFDIELENSKKEISSLKVSLYQCNRINENKDSINSKLTQVLLDQTQKINKLNEKISASESDKKIILSTFIDKRDGKSYKTIRFGNLEWMAENLNYNMDNNGSYFYPQKMLNATELEIQEAIKFYSISPNHIKDKKGIYLFMLFNPILALVQLKYPDGWRYYTSLSAAKEACPEGWRLPNRNDVNILNENIDQIDKLIFGLGVAWWKKNYNNPILEIRLGDYFGTAVYWSGVEISNKMCTIDYDSNRMELNVNDIWENHEQDLGYPIRCVRDISN